METTETSETVAETHHPQAKAPEKTALALIARFLPAIAIATFLLLIVTLDKPQVLASVEADTESVIVHVANQDQMRIVLPRALLLTDEGERCAEDITLRTEQGADVFFTVSGPGRLSIATSGPTASQIAGRGVVRSSDGVFAEIGAVGDCAWQGLLRLPVAGGLSLGVKAAGDASIEEFYPLTQGRIHIQGRAVERVFGIIPLSLLVPFTPMEPGKLFEGGEFHIPAGSRLEGGPSRFFGFAEIDLADTGSQTGLRVAASSNTREVWVHAPAPRTSRGDLDGPSSLEADVVSMTFGTRLTHDPNLHLLFGGFSAFVLIGGVVSRLFITPKVDVA